jgi:hypothetical protein
MKPARLGTARLSQALEDWHVAYVAWCRDERPTTTAAFDLSEAAREVAEAAEELAGPRSSREPRLLKLLRYVPAAGAWAAGIAWTFVKAIIGAAVVVVPGVVAGIALARWLGVL